MAEVIDIVRLREILSASAALELAEAEDYRICAAIGASFLARGRSGRETLLVPLEKAVNAVGRAGGGFALTSAPRVIFAYESRQWEQPAAILECTDESVGAAFLVLVLDIARRLPEDASSVTWQRVLAVVEEWQALLSRRTILTPEEQMGLWGELWVIFQSEDPDSLIAGWRGPFGEPIDFFYDGFALEVKTSGRPHVHHVSSNQVEEPSGDHESFLMSLWIGTDPARGVSLGELVEKILRRVQDPAVFLRVLARAGYSPQDHREYAARHIPLESASWFRTTDVPRVRVVDEGVSNVRYVVTLDLSKCLDDLEALKLWRHFGCKRFTEGDDHGD